MTGFLQGDEHLVSCGFGNIEVFGDLLQARWRIYTTEMEELVILAHSRLTRSLEKEECHLYLHVETCPPTP